jgi:hypothetical protein
MMHASHGAACPAKGCKGSTCQQRRQYGSRSLPGHCGRFSDRALAPIRTCGTDTTRICLPRSTKRSNQPRILGQLLGQLDGASLASHSEVRFPPPSKRIWNEEIAAIVPSRLRLPCANAQMVDQLRSCRNQQVSEQRYLREVFEDRAFARHWNRSQSKSSLQLGINSVGPLASDRAGQEFLLVSNMRGFCGDQL